MKDFPPGERLPQQNKFECQHWMDQNQAMIASPPFPKTAPDAEPLSRARRPAARSGRAACASGRPGGWTAATRSSGRAGRTACPQAAPAANPRRRSRISSGFNPPILQPTDPESDHRPRYHHPEEGKTYRYALRYRLFNPLFNNKAFAQPAVAAQFAIAGPDPVKKIDPKAIAWSGPVAIEPSTYVFVRKINPVFGPGVV